MRVTEAFSRVAIDQQLKDVGWRLTDGRSVHFEYTLGDGTRADYVLCDRDGRSLAVLEAKKTSLSPREGEQQGRAYAEQLGVPYVFLSNGEETWFWEPAKEAHPRRIATLFSQQDLERRHASRTLRMDPTDIAIDPRIVDRGYQHECIDTVCRAMVQGQRKLLVEMATGTGKTRTSAALIKRLFDANQVSRVLFLVDRNTLAVQAEEAFVEHLPNLPCYRVPLSGRRFQDEKRITVVTLQTLINEYEKYSAGYFDLILIDECHRSIYGQFRRALDHFDGVKIGLTATPCTIRDRIDVDDDDKAAVRDTLRFFEVDKPTFAYRLKEAIEDDHLVPYEIYRALTVKTAASGGFEVRRDEIDWDALSPEDRAELEEAFGDQNAIMVDPSALERKFTIPERNRAMVREFRQVLECGYVAPNGARRAPDWGKTIVFAVNKRHAEALATLFDQAFADKKPSPEIRYADFVVSNQGADDTVDGPGRIKRFKRETYPQVLVSVNMLDTGFDHPETVNLVMARFTRSSILYQQMRGRGTRKADHIAKSRFTIWDFTGVTLHHGDEEGEHEGGLVVVRQPKPDSFTRAPRRTLTLDIHDEIDPATREWVVVEADGSGRFETAAERRAEALGAAFEAWLAGETFDSDQLRLLHMVKAQIVANAETMAEFADWRFDQPPFSINGGYDRARQVFGGETALNEMLARLNTAVFDEPEARPDDEDAGARV